MHSFPVILLAVVLGISVIVTIYTMFDHCSGKGALRPDASVIDISRKRFNRFKLKTTVLFDDGFKYVSFRAESNPSGLGGPIGYRGEGTDEVLERAIARHDELLEKKKKGC